MENKPHCERILSNKIVPQVIVSSEVRKITIPSNNICSELMAIDLVDVSQDKENISHQQFLIQGNAIKECLKTKCSKNTNMISELSEHLLHTESATIPKNVINKPVPNENEQHSTHKQLCQDLMKALVQVSNEYKSKSTKPKAKKKRNENKKSAMTSDTPKAIKNLPPELLSNGRLKKNVSTGVSKHKSFAENIDFSYISTKDKQNFIEGIKQLYSAKKNKNAFKKRQSNNIRKVENSSNPTICEQITNSNRLYAKPGYLNSVRKNDSILNSSFSKFSKYMENSTRTKIEQFKLREETGELSERYITAAEGELPDNNNFQEDLTKQYNNRSKYPMKSSGIKHKSNKNRTRKKFYYDNKRCCNNDFKINRTSKVSIGRDSNEKILPREEPKMNEIPQPPHNYKNLCKTYHYNTVKEPKQSRDHIKQLKDIVKMADPEKIRRVTHSSKKLNPASEPHLRQILKSLNYLKIVNSIHLNGADTSNKHPMKHTENMSHKLKSSINLNSLLKSKKVSKFHISRQSHDKRKAKSAIKSHCQNQSKGVQTSPSLFMCKCSNSSNNINLHISQSKNVLRDSTNPAELNDVTKNVNLEKPHCLEEVENQRKDDIFLLSHCSKDSIKYFEKCCKQNSSNFLQNPKPTNLSDLEEEFSSCISFRHVETNKTQKTEYSSGKHLPTSPSVVFYSATSLCAVCHISTSFSAINHGNSLDDSECTDPSFDGN